MHNTSHISNWQPQQATSDCTWRKGLIISRPITQSAHYYIKRSFNSVFLEAFLCLNRVYWVPFLRHSVICEIRFPVWDSQCKEHCMTVCRFHLRLIPTWKEFAITSCLTALQSPLNSCIWFIYVQIFSFLVHITQRIWHGCNADVIWPLYFNIFKDHSVYYFFVCPLSDAVQGCFVDLRKNFILPYHISLWI